MAEVIVIGFTEIIGCTDPLASNYDPTATSSCNGCCQYGMEIVGCRDPLAINYDSTANSDCNGCCIYEQVLETGTGFGSGPSGGLGGGLELGPGETVGVGFGGGLGTGLGTGTGGGPKDTPCAGPFSITVNGEVLGVTSAECCNAIVIGGGLPDGYEYYWDGRACYYRQIINCPSDKTCVTCNSFDWWNDTYIANHNGQSLQVSNPTLWQYLVDVVSNSGQTFYVQTSTGNLINSDCCVGFGVFKDGVCFCNQTPPTEEYEPKCISTLLEFLSFISTTVGYNFWVTNSLMIGSALGLTNTQINFITANINNTGANGTQAKLLISNALNITGGFYVNFGVTSNSPISVTKGICDNIGGYWYTTTASSGGGGTGGGVGGPIELGPIETVDLGTSFGSLGSLGGGSLGGGSVGTGFGLDTGGFVAGREIETSEPIIVTPPPTTTPTGPSGQCMCKPIVDQCDIDITEVEVITATDFYNNPIQIVSYKSKDEQISEACCNRLIKDYNLPWAWQSPWCYATPKEDCLPIKFSLNDEKMTIPACSNSLELSMWVYFGKPENSCQPIPDPPDDDIIIIDGAVCDITLTPNTGSLSNGGGLGGPIEIGPIEIGPIENVGIGFGGPGLDSGTFLTTRQVESSETIVVSTTGNTTCCYSIFNPILARITTTDSLLNSSLIQVKEYNSSTDYFEKWVQIKATLPTSGLTLNFGVYLEIYQGLNCCCNYDIFIDDIRVDCPKDESLITYNNVQCPGFEITRVIDNKKSWVYNPGTPLVGISDYDNIEREDGSFGMLNGEGNINRTFAPSLDADIPWRYTDYFVQSSVLERHSNLVLNSKELGLTFDMCADCPISGTTLGCPSGYTLTASGTTSVCVKTLSATTEIISASTVPTVTYLNLYDLENYKKTFQSFWIPFMEQFIPATTIWVAGERWCNEPCTIIDLCDYDFELTEAEISIQPVQQGFFPSSPRSVGSTVVPTTVSSTVGTTNVAPAGGIPTTSNNIVTIENLGLTTETYIIPTEDQLSVYPEIFRYNFSDITTVTELVP